MNPAVEVDDSQLFEPNDGVSAALQDPEEQPSQSGAREYGPFNRDLPKELQDALHNLILEAEREDLYQRRVEVMRDRRNRFYYVGIQHIYEDLSGAFVLQTPGQLAPDPTSPGNSVQCGQFINDYNIFGRALQIIIAKLTENPAGLVFEPDAADDTVDEQASKAAEAYKVNFERYNDYRDWATMVVYMMGLSGRTVSWTRPVTDQQRWGIDENGNPRTRETSTVYGVLESKCPVMATSLGQCPYFIITEDPHLYTAKMEHPEFADKICEQGDDGIADTQFERLARIGALQGQSASFQVTDTYNFYVEDKNVWFRPAMFMSKCLDAPYVDRDPAGNPIEHPENVDESGQSKTWTLRDALNEAFPDGSRAEFIGSTYVGSRNESMDDALAMDFPYAGKGAARNAIMDPAVQIQDDFNDDQNNYHEVKVTGWPSTWLNEDYADLKFMNDQVAAPYCFRALKSRPPRDAKMEDMFYREPNPEIPASFMEHTEYMATQLLQFILAIPSAVQGAGMPDQKTKGGYQEAIYQAMGQLGVIFGAMQRLYSKVVKQAANWAAQRSRGDPKKALVMPGPKGNITLNMADLGKGNFLCHPDQDSGYPESTMQVRQTLQMILELALKDPEIAQALLSAPENWSFIFRVFGVTGLVIPEARARDKQAAEIELLVQQSPVGPTPEEQMEAEAQHIAGTAIAQRSGQPAPPPLDPMSLMHSSIPVGPLDFHQWEFAECQDKLSDYPWVQQQILAGNEAGILNIQLHAQEHQKIVQQMAAQQAAAVEAEALKLGANVSGKLGEPVEPAGKPAAA
jgi:hypothetical protein